MGSIAFNPERAIADVFNSAVASWAIGAAWELGILDELRNAKRLNAKKFALAQDLDHNSTEGLITALVVTHIIARDGDDIVAGVLFDEAYRTKSLFHWLCLGSGPLFVRMQNVLRNQNRKGNYYTRDSAAIAYACRDINQQYFDPAFRKAVEGLDYKPSHIVDLGCGSGERLMQLLNCFPGTQAIGVDLAGPALEVAASEAADRGYGDRLAFIEGDARAIEPQAKFTDVDLLTCFMMGHDFWPRDNCVTTLRRLRDAFPKVRRFLLGDATRILMNSKGSRTAVAEENVPVFTLGFELGHQMMGVYLPTLDEWEGVFAEGGWRCVDKHIIDELTLSVVFVLERT